MEMGLPGGQSPGPSAGAQRAASTWGLVLKYSSPSVRVHVRTCVLAVRPGLPYGGGG